jgi:ATP-binding protein involved in chromosome partitioning
MVHQDAILAALSKVQEPELHKDLVTLNMVRDLVVEGGNVRFTLMLTTPACPLKDQMKKESEEAVRKVAGVESVEIQLSAEVKKTARLGENAQLPAGIKNILAVASGKGGVGKSTTSVNLAVALQKSGARVGLLDADVYGPNIPMMMGIPEERPNVNEKEQLIPFENHGIKVISIGFLVDPGKAVIWRGPMLHGVIKQFLTSVALGELDYLVVDLPPGTGDAQLSLVQTVPLSGAVIVTTPQAVALSDVRRSIGMFNEVRVPVLGIIENMAGLECPHCHTHIDLFDGQGGKTLSEEFQVPLLGHVPFDPAVGQGGDKGIPVTLSRPDSAQAKAFRSAAEWVAARISVLNAQEDANQPVISVH